MGGLLDIDLMGWGRYDAVFTAGSTRLGGAWVWSLLLGGDTSLSEREKEGEIYNVNNE